jgi:hypothetical protein
MEEVNTPGEDRENREQPEKESDVEFARHEGASLGDGSGADDFSSSGPVNLTDPERRNRK